jgi:hypothetical protein
MQARLQDSSKDLARRWNLTRGTSHEKYDLEMVNFQDVGISMMRRDLWTLQCPNGNPSEEVGADFARRALSPKDGGKELMVGGIQMLSSPDITIPRVWIQGSCTYLGNRPKCFCAKLPINPRVH